MKIGIAALALAVGACGRTSPPPTVVGNQVAGAPGFLVWIEVEGQAVTRWLDADGRERGRADGAWIASGGGLWKLDVTTRAEATTGCREGDGGAIQPGTATLTDVALVGPAGRLPLATGEREDDADEQAHGAGLLASLGRYAFVEEGAYVYGCGAHGNNAASASVIDLTTRRPPPAAWVTDADVTGLAGEARAAIDNPELEEGELHVGATIPAWVGGALQVRHLLWIDTCYACGNGAWSSYTSAAWVADPRVPAPLATEAAQVPPAVARAIEARDDAHVGVSWGTVDDAWRATFTAR